MTIYSQLDSILVEQFFALLNHQSNSPSVVHFQIDDQDLVVDKPYIAKISKPPLEVCPTHSSTQDSSSYHPSIKLKVKKLDTSMPITSSKESHKYEPKSLPSNMQLDTKGVFLTFSYFIFVSIFSPLPPHWGKCSI